ncbi:hypothetical protein ACJW30_12G039700 [Castanea mollissima]
MARGLAFTVGLTVLIALVLVHPICCATTAMVNHTCSASSCGNIHNISFPFRLNTDPENCGDPRYELSCENNHTVLLYLCGGKYFVQEISYNNYTIRIVDSGMHKDNYFSFSTPTYSLSLHKFSLEYVDTPTYTTDLWKGTDLPNDTVLFNNPQLSRSLALMSCEKPVNSPLYLDTSTCNFNDNSSSISDSKRRYRYVKVGRTKASEVEDSCQVEKMFLTSWPINNDDPNISCTDVHNELAYVLFYLETKTALGIPCVVALLIYKWRKRHLSMYDAIEEFLQSQINLMPIRYSYSNIRKMSKSFKDKLGEGGYGTVYRGKLETNGQEFINEVATIGRIHHVNVVQLIGFCAEGPKHALIYEFISNGSIPLSIKKTYKISLGVAHGIEYLHRGCDMQILHFDIKPHNILLDENFIPKVSDFGLAKLYSTNDSIVSLIVTRGTLGYIASKLFYKNIGRVSYKADVYSFGMLLLEMASRTKNTNAFANHSSQIYFPTWVYGQYSEGNDIEIEDATEEEKKIVKKMIIVALWCIQMKPSDRPSMNKVVEMLEGEVECLQMPSKPFPSSSPVRPTGDVGDNLNSTSSSFQSGESSQSAIL